MRLARREPATGGPSTRGNIVAARHSPSARLTRWGLICCLLFCSAASAAQRVVSLAPSLTQIVVELGAQQRLVGMLDAGPRPAGLAQVASVGHYGQLNSEALLALKPDLLLLWPGSVGAAQRDQLQRLGIATLVVDPHTLDELAGQIEVVSQHLGAAERGQRLATGIRQRLAALSARYRRQVPLRVFYQVWDKPLFTLGGQQIISDALRVCGGENIFNELRLPAPQVSIESVLQRDPQVILVPDQAQADAWRAWPEVEAVKAGRVWTRDGALERPSAAMIDAVESLCREMASPT